MDGDGTQAGYDIPLTRAISDAVNIPVIASGGAGELAHFAQALTDGGADAALAASLFHYKQLTIAEVKQYLTQQGIAVRMYELIINCGMAAWLRSDLPMQPLPIDPRIT
jgi:imidazole glycerol-phosphate synthase subunit HisF